MNLNDLFNEEKVRLDPKCWTGKKIGNPKTKMKGGTRVNNCVPAESVNEMDKSQTPPGRDGSNDSDAGKKEYTAKATTAKKVAKDAKKILNKELNKKQGVAEANIQPTGAASRSHISNLSNPVTNSVVHPSSGKEIGLITQQPSGEYYAHPTSTALANSQGGTFATKDEAHQFIRNAHAKAIKNGTVSDKWLKQQPLPQFAKGQGVAEATGDEKFDTMMGQIQREPKYPDSQMPPTDVKDLYNWAVENNKLYHEIFAEWANREGYKSVAPALQRAGDLDTEALDYWTPRVWKIYWGEVRGIDSEMPPEWAKKRVPDELRDYLETVFDAYNRIVFDWPTEYRQIGMAEAIGDLGSKRDIGKSVRKWRKSRGLDEQGGAEDPNGYNVVRYYEKTQEVKKLTNWLEKEAGLPRNSPLYFDDVDLVYGNKTIVPGALINPKLTFNDLLTAVVQASKQGMAEGFNGEYDDEAGMAQGNLYTIAKAAKGLLDTIDDRDNLPEWVQEKIAKVEGMLVTSWNYMQSQKAQGIDPQITESICSLTEAEEIFNDFERSVQERGLSEDIYDTITDDEIIAETAAWRRKEGKSKKGGLNAKGVASYRRENPGSKLQMAVTTKPSKLKKGSKAAKRRKSFCARMSGVKGPMKKPNGKPTRKALALRKWNC